MAANDTAVRRTRLTPEQRRAQLIELGVEMLSTRTLEELSVELIAERAGISRGLLFHYFASKQDFHAAVTRAAAAEMLRRTEPDPALPPAEALRASVDAYVAHVEENPDSYTSLVRGAASGDADLRAIFGDTRAAMAGRIVLAYAAVGVDLTPATRLAVDGWLSYAEECVVRWLADRTLSRDELLTTITRALPAIVAAVAGDPSLTDVLA
ncbi:TetR/AcrR family transcriptional regulator [Jatrophihabitans fulvus]